MITNLIELRNPKWVTLKDEDNNVINDSDGNPIRFIDCECKWSHLGDNTQSFLNFSANPNDPMQHGKDLYAALVKGDHGEIEEE